MNSLVSVIIPAYNAEQTIIASIESVLNQTYTNIEIFVIDDGSKDQTRSLLDTYKQKNNIENLHIVSQTNSGPSMARNLGISLAKGDLIAFLDSDDCWKPNKLERQLVFFRDQNIALVGCRYQIGERKNSDCTCQPIEISFNRLLYHNYFSTTSVICRTSILKTMKFNESQKYSEDYRLWLLIAASHCCILLDDCMVQLYDKPIYGSVGLSSNLWKMEKGELSNYRHLFSCSLISMPQFILVSSCSFFKYLYRVFQKYFN